MIVVAPVVNDGDSLICEILPHMVSGDDRTVDSVLPPPILVNASGRNPARGMSTHEKSVAFDIASTTSEVPHDTTLLQMMVRCAAVLVQCVRSRVHVSVCVFMCWML